MRLSQAVEARQQQTQRIDPRQILSSEMLMWTPPELEAAIESELAENPALELRDDAPRDLAVTPPPASDPPLPLAPAPAAEREIRLPFGAGEPSDENDDPMERVASSRSLRDHLREQVGQVAADARTAALVRCLIESVDDRGYLVADLADVAEDTRSAPAEIEAAVRALQTMDPPGVGARDLRECLTIQAEHLDQLGEGDPLARRVLSRCWDDLVARREQRIASRLGADVEDVRAALTFLRQSLTPYPGGAFRPSWENRPSSGVGRVRADVVFRRTEAGFGVELPGDFSECLLLAPLWQRLAERPDACKDDGMRRYVREHVERAEAFLHGLARRGRTLRALADLLTELQQGFIETGDRAFLRPLTRAAVAERLGLDESVVSRCVADKFAQLPSGDVLPLDAFFGNHHAVREALQKVIDAENPENPYSDDELADLLTAQGFPLARRTVAKYRGLEKILPARLRKRGG